VRYKAGRAPERDTVKLARLGLPGAEMPALSGRFPYLRAGDVVEVEIEGLGRQRHEMVAA
jgi:2-keto-4-pentenoate hydratase/2-oxohepta-3-ene-1,7-dioic acid hydratase in catechol pathway